MRMVSVLEEYARTNEGRTTLVETPEAVPLFRVVPLQDTTGGRVDNYQGVQREDTGEVVSVVSSRYALLQHRAVAEAVHAIGASLEAPSPAPDAPHGPRFPREQIRLYAHGRRMEMKLVIGTRYGLDGANEFYPGIRVLNSLDGAWALRMEAFAVRIACTNQLYAGSRSYMAFREPHLSSSEDMLGQLQKATYEVLEHFDEALDLYARSMDQTLDIPEFVPALLEEGIPRLHVERMAERLPEHFGSTLWGEIPRWDAYQIATDYLTHEVHVNPDRERQFERAAARALLLDGGAIPVENALA